MSLTKIRPYIFSVTVIVFLVVLTIGNHYLNKNLQVPDAFLPRWLSAKLWLEDGISPYDDSVELKVSEYADEKAIPSSETVLKRYFEPVYNLVIYIPFTFFDYDIARALFMTVIELSIIGIILFSKKIVKWQLRIGELVAVLIFLVFWYPSVRSILFADSLPFFLFLFILAIYLALNNNPTASGFLLAGVFWTVEFSLITAIFLIIWQISMKDMSIAWSYLSGLAFLLLSSFLFFPNWLVDWFRVFLTFYPDLALIKTPLTQMANLFPENVRLISIILHVIILFFILIEWFGSLGKKGRVITWKAIITLTLTYLLNLQSTSIHLLILIPSLLFVLKYMNERWRIFGKIISWILLLGIVFGYWIIFRDFGNWYTIEPRLIILGLPLISILGMEWIRWWAVKIPQPIFES